MCVALFAALLWKTSWRGLVSRVTWPQQEGTRTSLSRFAPVCDVCSWLRPRPVAPRRRLLLAPPPPAHTHTHTHTHHFFNSCVILFALFRSLFAYIFSLSLSSCHHSFRSIFGVRRLLLLLAERDVTRKKKNKYPATVFPLFFFFCFVRPALLAG